MYEDTKKMAKSNNGRALLLQTSGVLTPEQLCTVHPVSQLKHKFYTANNPWGSACWAARQISSALDGQASGPTVSAKKTARQQTDETNTLNKTSKNKQSMQRQNGQNMAKSTESVVAPSTHNSVLSLLFHILHCCICRYLAMVATSPWTQPSHWLVALIILLWYCQLLFCPQHTTCLCLLAFLEISKHLPPGAWFHVDLDSHQLLFWLSPENGLGSSKNAKGECGEQQKLLGLSLGKPAWIVVSACDATLKGISACLTSQA